MRFQCAKQVGSNASGPSVPPPPPPPPLPLLKPLSLLKHKSPGGLGKAAREKASSSLFQQFSALQCPTAAVPALAADPSQPRWQACLKQVPGQFEGQSVYDAVIERVLLPEPTQHHIVLELGALMGQGSCYMSHRLQSIARSHGVQSSFTVLDIWGPVAYYGWLKRFQFYEQWDALVSVSQAVQGNDTASIRPVWEHLMCTSGAAAAITSHIQGSAKDHTVGALFADESISFVYLDTTHQYADTMEELAVWWPKVRRGGWLCGDDYNEGLFPMPRAIRDWKKAYAVQEPVETWTAVRNVAGTVTNSQFCIGKGVPARQYSRQAHTKEGRGASPEVLRAETKRGRVRGSETRWPSQVRSAPSRVAASSSRPH